MGKSLPVVLTFQKFPESVPFPFLDLEKESVPFLFLFLALGKLSFPVPFPFPKFAFLFCVQEHFARFLPAAERLGLIEVWLVVVVLLLQRLVV